MMVQVAIPGSASQGGDIDKGVAEIETPARGMNDDPLR
jgi:hypothetical protein